MGLILGAPEVGRKEFKKVEPPLVLGARAAVLFWEWRGSGAGEEMLKRS
jgi:hypothetical protein